MPMFLEVTMLNVSGAALGYDVCETQRRDTGFDGVEKRVRESGIISHSTAFSWEQLPN